MPLKKKCSVCKKEMTLSEFPLRASASLGVDSRCKACTREYASAYRIKNWEKIKEKQRLDYAARRQERLAYAARPDVRKKKAERMKAARAADPFMANLKFRSWQYGLSLETLRDMLAAGCAVCGRTEKLHIDHDHACCPTKNGCPRSCGKCVRGVLCHWCNSALGLLGDNAERVAALAAYLSGNK